MIRPDPGWLQHRLELEAGSLADYLGVPLAPPADPPAVDVAGYRPATSVVHKDPLRGTSWHAPGDACEVCDRLLDADP